MKHLRQYIRKLLENTLTKAMCQRHSTAWIEPNGKTHIMPQYVYGQSWKTGEDLTGAVEHGDYFWKILKQDRPVDLNQWLKVSGTKNISVESGRPTKAQYRSFLEVIINCLAANPGIHEPEDSITLVAGGSKQSLSTDDLFQQYAPELEDKYYEILIGE